jgi:hypothetical protein
MAEIIVLESYTKNVTIENGLLDLQMFLERINFVQQDIEEEYFNFDNPEDHEYDLIWGYHRGKVKANIVSDYIFKMREKLAELDAYMEQAKALQECDAVQ